MKNLMIQIFCQKLINQQIGTDFTIPLKKLTDKNEGSIEDPFKITPPEDITSEVKQVH